MSNNKNLSKLANVLDDASSGQFLKSTGSGGVVFDTIAAGATVYAEVSNLPITGLTAGDLAFVTANTRFYVSNGTGWYSVALLNQSPSISAVKDASNNTTPFTLATDQSNTVITITASDPENATLTYTYSVTSGALNGTTVTQGTGASTNVFTIAPHASQSAVFTLTFTVSDGTNTDTSANSFTLSFGMSGTQQAKFTSSDIQSGDNFGAKVAIDGDYAVVGASSEDTGASNAGAVYVFVRSGTTWTQQAKLQSPSPAQFMYFGRDVAIDGTTIVVGENGYNSSRGRAFVFTRSGTTWSQQAILTGSDSAQNDQFGYSVSISGDTVAVAAKEHNSSQGAIYAFTRSGTTWSQQAKMVASDASNNDQNGWAVAVDGDTIVSGAWLSGSNSEGAAYVFTRSGTTWSQQAKLTASDAATTGTGANFGAGVSIDGDNIVVGAPKDAPHSASGVNDSGAAYVYVRSGTTWSQQAKLIASDGATQGSNQEFGYSVAIDGNQVLAGARWNNSYGGSCYLFGRSGTTWSQSSKFTSSDNSAADNDEFGHALDLEGGTAVISATNDGGTYTGSVYIFT